MTFTQSDRGEFVDQERGLSVRHAGGGPDGWFRKDIVGSDWFIRFSFQTLVGTDGEGLKLTGLKVSDNYPGTNDEARVLVREFLDAWRRLPFMMKGRTEPIAIIM